MSAWTCRQFAGKAAQKIVPPHPRIPCWKGLGANSEEKREPVSGINAGVVDSLKVLDPQRPIREGGNKSAKLTDREWQVIDEHALQLQAAATLVSLGGTGRADRGWVTSPAWQDW